MHKPTLFSVALLLVTLACTKSGSAAPAVQWKIDRGRIEVTTAALRARFERGTLTGLVNRRTGTDFTARDANLDAAAANVPAGLLSMAAPATEADAVAFANEWWDEKPIQVGNPAIHHPDSRSTVTVEAIDERHARQTVSGLAAGDQWFPDERLVLDIGVISPEDEIEVRVTVPSASPGVFGASLATLGWRTDFRRITPDTCGRDWGYNDVKTRMQQSKGGVDSTTWPSFWRFPFIIGYIKGKPGVCMIWSEDTEYRCLQQFTRHEARQTDLAFGTQNLPPFKELKECRSVAWRIQAFAGDWRQAADRYRAALIAQGILKDRPAWTADITAIYLGAGGAEWESVPLAKFFTPEEAKRVLIHIQGWRAAGFDNNLWDYTPQETLAKNVTTLREHGFRVMCYMNPMFCRWTTKPGMEDPPTKEFNDVYSYKNQFTGKGWGPMHLGLDAYRKWFEGKAAELAGGHAIQAIYLDCSYGVPNDYRGRIDGKSPYEGMLAFCHELRAQHPAFGFATEGVMSLNASLVSWGITTGTAWGNFTPDPTTGIGPCAVELARDAHPIVTYLLRDYYQSYVHGHNPDSQASFHLNEDYAERRGTLATVPLPSEVATQNPEAQLMLRKARLFAARGLKPCFPDTLAAGVRSYYRAADGTLFRCLERPYGSCLAEGEGRQEQIHYARVHGVTTAALPSEIGVSGWIGRDRNGLIGLNPEYYYCAFPAASRGSPVEICKLPEGAFIRQSRSMPEGLVVQVEWLKPEETHPAVAKVTAACTGTVMAVFGTAAGDVPGSLKKGQHTVKVAIPGTLVFQTGTVHAVTLPYSLARKPGEEPRVTVSRRNGLPEFPPDDAVQAGRQVAHGPGNDPIGGAVAPFIRETMGVFNKRTYQDYWLQMPAQPASLRFMPRMSREFKEATMTVMVNGRVLWEGKELQANPLKTEVAVDLAPYAGQAVLLTLASDTARHSDWFVWFNPRLEAKP